LNGSRKGRHWLLVSEQKAMSIHIMHPLMIQFALLLLIVSPLLVLVAGVLTPLRGRASLAIAFLLFLLGTACVSVITAKLHERAKASDASAAQPNSERI
jgi:positive regulator of sigma E activity